MNADIGVVRDYFLKLHIQPEIADIYLALHAYGPQTISELARNAGVERTRVYRLLDELRQLGLIETELQYKRMILRAAPVANLQLLLAKREEELQALRRSLGQVEELLARTDQTKAGTRVQFYRGPDGIKQMFWNETKGTSENLAILYENMQIKTNRMFFERWARTCNERGIVFRGIISDHFIQTQQDWYTRHSNERLAHWQARYVSAEDFPITHSMVVYDDVVAYYNWIRGEIFGIEIYNAQIADAQRRFFEMLWEKGQAVDDLKGLEGLG